MEQGDAPPNGGDDHQAPNGEPLVPAIVVHDVGVQVDTPFQIQENFLHRPLPPGALHFLRAIYPEAADTMESLRTVTDEWRWWGAQVNPIRPAMDPTRRSPLHAFCVESILTVLETFVGELFSPYLIDAVEAELGGGIGLTPPDITRAREFNAKTLMSLHEQCIWFGHYQITLREYQSNRSNGFVPPAHKQLLDQRLEDSIWRLGWTHDDVIRRNSLTHVNELQSRITPSGTVGTNGDPTILLFDRLQQIMQRITTKRWLVFRTEWRLDYGEPRHASALAECEHVTYAAHVAERARTFDKKTAVYEAARLRKYETNGKPSDEEQKVGGLWLHWAPFGTEKIVVGGSEHVGGQEAVVEMELTPPDDEHLCVQVTYEPDGELSTHELLLRAHAHADSLDLDERQHWIAMFLDWFEEASRKLIS
ncbi:hypothetical protein M3Y99_01812700 [Aphelenchoides fujianensis]|nr:hypothetical protein M3Y99_01812700 [Aphelenchoides fujianensis]